MALDAPTVAKAIAFITEKWKNKECVLCGSNAWEVSGFVNLVLLDSTDRLSARSPVQTLPSFAVICKVCGNTHLVNAIFAGLVSK